MIFIKSLATRSEQRRIKKTSTRRDNNIRATCDQDRVPAWHANGLGNLTTCDWFLPAIFSGYQRPTDKLTWASSTMNMFEALYAKQKQAALILLSLLVDAFLILLCSLRVASDLIKIIYCFHTSMCNMQYVSLSQNSLIFYSTDNNLSFTFLYSLFFFLTSTIVKTLSAVSAFLHWCWLPCKEGKEAYNVHVHRLRLTGQSRDRIRRFFFLWALNVVLKNNYRRNRKWCESLMIGWKGGWSGNSPS